MQAADAAAPPPEPMRPDVGLPAEPPGSKELVGLALQAVIRWRDVPLPPKAAEVSAEGLREAAKLTALAWNVEVSESGRMRIVFASHALPLPRGSELRARSDRYGNLVLWPNATDYRIAAPGTLRPLLGEQRADVTPLSIATPVSAGEGKRLGTKTRKVELASSLGVVKLEVARFVEAGEGGPLFCRALVELVGVDPRVAVCEAGEVPLAASYAWKDGGGISIEVTSVARKTDLSPADMVSPPLGASFASAGLPVSPAGIFLTRDELAAFRTSPLALPAKEDPSAPGEGFIAENGSDALQYLLIDGVPVVAVPPGAERYVIGPPKGRYVVQWRTFLGDRVLPPQTVELPLRIVLAKPGRDAGAPDGGVSPR